MPNTIPNTPSISDQRHFWDWHWQNWQDRKVLNQWTERRAKEILNLLKGLNVSNPRILDLGCGCGWFTERLTDLGQSYGIDLSPEAISAAQARRPDITYIAGNLYDAPLQRNFFEVVVSQEVIAHVQDQAKYINLSADVLRVGGHLIITTGNKWVMDRLGDVGWNVQPPQHIANQLTRKELVHLLKPRFQVLKVLTIVPHGTRGILRLINSYRLNWILKMFLPQGKIDELKERAGLGWQMIVLARKTR
jgi:2-polyprenyl-3-methyl-5-hydroxy-6-metoxy-1,4-benzoquinol methylase